MFFSVCEWYVCEIVLCEWLVCMYEWFYMWLGVHMSACDWLGYVCEWLGYVYEVYPRDWYDKVHMRRPENNFWDSVFIFHFVFKVGSLFSTTLFQAGLNNSPIKMLAFSCRGDCRHALPHQVSYMGLGMNSGFQVFTHWAISPYPTRIFLRYSQQA